MKKTLLIFLIAFSTTLAAQIERPKWEFGGGIRFNYTGLNGNMSAYRNSDGYNFDLGYEEIGMDNYSPSFAIALGGRIKKWNLEFGGSRGVYEGSFITPTDMVKDDVQIDSGSVVSGKLDMTMFMLTTNFGLIQRKHDLGIGIGILALNMGTNYSTTDINGQEIKLGGDQWFPMPFLALGGRLKFGKFRINGTAGGAIFIGNMNGDDFDVKYITLDLDAAYDFYQKGRFGLSADLGYRFLFMDTKIENELGWYKEKDIYQGPYATVRVKYYSEEMWKFVKRKDRKKDSSN
jgi:hypothetical protein